MRRTQSIAALGVVCLAAVAVAPRPGLAADDKPGRYTMSPADGGFVRLDTETGAMALCHRRQGQWACEEMPDATRDLRRDNDRLTAENKELKADIRRMEEMLGLGDGKKQDGDRRADRPGGKLQLPSEEDVDKALGYIERMFKKFRDKMKQFEGEEGRGTPL